MYTVTIVMYYLMFAIFLAKVRQYVNVSALITFLGVDMTDQPIVLIIGTRPEGIKMLPVYFACKDQNIPAIICSTAQHDHLLQEVFDLFGVQPDFDLGIMRQGQDLSYITQAVLHKTKELFLKIKPACVVVQGDTTSTMVAALSAFYQHIPVAHVEAGLRSHDLQAPFPEEMNRRTVGQIGTLHFTPTAQASANLLSEGVVKESIFCTGNTVVDALRLIKKQLDINTLLVRDDIKKIIQQAQQNNKKIILLTMHRRESFNGGIERALQAIKQLLIKHQDVFCIYPYHPNPQVVQGLESTGLTTLSNIFLTEPIAYKDLVYVLHKVDCVVTDSGGIQEEAVSLGKPTVVLREKTERVEGVYAGLAYIVGTDYKKIIETIENILLKGISVTETYSLYGDGYAAQKIVRIINQYVQNNAFVVNKNKNREHNKHLGKEIKTETRMKKVCVVGLGYIGLPTAIILAENRCDVIGVDIDQERVKKINSGDPDIYEPEVYEKLQYVLGTSRFRATIQPEQADVFIIAVPTPLTSDKKADLSCVFDAAKNIATVLTKGVTVILESTIPVGTTQRVAEFLQEETKLQAGTDFYVAYCPERVLPGKIFSELVDNDRIIGGFNRASVNRAKEIYKEFVEGNLYLTDAKTAEMIKLVENSSRDAQIAFAQQVGAMAEAAGLNPFEVIELANKHPRVNILKPSPGVGGHCIAVDPWFLIETFPQQTQFLQAVRSINDNRPLEVIRTIDKEVALWEQQNTHTCKVLLLGLTYKPNVDDLRESPALKIAQELYKKNSYSVLIAEPHVNNKKLHTLFGDSIVNTSYGIEQADIIVYLVAHQRFSVIDTKLLSTKKVLDFCGALYKPKKNANQSEQLFWPARSVLDFFITNQESEDRFYASNKDKEKQV